MTDNNKLISLYPNEGKDLLSFGNSLISGVETKTIKEVIYSVLCGENLRDSTEQLTRKRLLLSNGSLLMLFLNGYFNDNDFIDKIPKLSVEQLKDSKRKENRWILEWMIGLTDKQVQNVLRDNPIELDRYRTRLDKTINESLERLANDFGEVEGNIILNDKEVKLNWKFLSFLFMAIGSQTLTLRGSEKSMYGKLFEKLILGTVLTVLGFNQIDKNNPTKTQKVFWLSEQADKRESDATLIYSIGKGIRFDIGFIGRGNTEISLDKVTRFEREIEFGRTKHYLATFIIVDRIGEKSRIYEMAKKVDGTVIQMSMSYWPKELAKKLKEVVGYEHEIIDMDEESVKGFLKTKIDKVDISKFV